jgi:hypothetical protein
MEPLVALVPATVPLLVAAALFVGTLRLGRRRPHPVAGAPEASHAFAPATASLSAPPPRR